MLHEKQHRWLTDIVIKGIPRSNRMWSRSKMMNFVILIVFNCKTKRATRSAIGWICRYFIGTTFQLLFFKNIILPETKVNIQCPCGPMWTYDVFCPQTKYFYPVSYTKRDITLDMIFLFLNFIII